MIEEDGANSDSGRRLEINVPCPIRRKHPPEQEGCIFFSNPDASTIQVDDVIESGEEKSI